MALLKDWALDMGAEGYSRYTIYARLKVVRFVAAEAGVQPDALTREHVLAYLGARDLAVRSRRAYLQHLKAWCEWRKVEDITAGIRRPPVPRAVPKPVGEPQLARLMLAARPEHRERAYLVLGAYAGLRSFETAKVRAEDLETVEGGWALRVVGKGGVTGLVPVPDVVVDVLHPWIVATGRGRLWPKATGGSVYSDLRRLGERAGVTFSSHQLRHRFGTAFYAESRDLLLTQQVMRHSNPTTTAGYALINADRAASVMARLPGAGGTELTDRSPA